MAPVGQTGDTVDEIMTRAATGCVIDNYAQDVLEVLEEVGQDYMPVVDDFATRRPLGVVSRHDLRRLVNASPDDPRVGHALMASVPIVSLGTKLRRLPFRLVEVPVALVVDEAGALAGFFLVARALPWMMNRDVSKNEATDR